MFLNIDNIAEDQVAKLYPYRGLIVDDLEYPLYVWQRDIFFITFIS